MSKKLIKVLAETYDDVCDYTESWFQYAKTHGYTQSVSEKNTLLKFSNAMKQLIKSG